MLRRVLDKVKEAVKPAKCAKRIPEVPPVLDPVIPTRDTRAAPDVTPTTRILSVLGVDEPDIESKQASPSLGDGWMVSDFYLWMHVLDDMGKTQE
jgi:hypothetical protein